ncbi:DUF6702 family protein [Parasphingorhabdus sp. DH2-15]|uniref:DUF6702 family protein n=1 Tax=Parasphingorhabdus sp. DH2-15 TaxID=3444112 RepID=UPI003F682398
MKQHLAKLLICVFAALLALPAIAHQQKITISTISHNSRTNMVEVVHRVPLHDAEHALKWQGERAPDIVTNIDSRRAFALYVDQNFTVSSNGETLKMALLGTEIEGGNVLIFQEAPSPGIGSELQIYSQILTNIWQRQENRVNLGTGTRVDTLIFRAGDSRKAAILR